MLTPPDLPLPYLLERLNAGFNVRAERLSFLPLGADASTAVYRAEDGGGFFFKLRWGAFNPITAELPAYLHRHGMPGLIAPLPARSGQAWARLDDAPGAPGSEYAMLLYPFVEGRNGYEQRPSPAQWQAFGAALAHLHAVRLPAALAAQLPRETFAALHRDQSRRALANAENTPYRDPVAVELAARLRGWRPTITAMLERTDALADALRAHPPAFVVCHSDIHAGNLHLTPDGRLFLVDWDAPLYAPKERDLQLVGGCPTWNDPRETALFYEGYGPQALDPAALVYYRYQRVIEDIAAYCAQLLDSQEGGEDRPRSLGFLSGCFQPGGEVEIAVESDRRLLG